MTSFSMSMKWLTPQSVMDGWTTWKHNVLLVLDYVEHKNKIDGVYALTVILLPSEYATEY
jgi:hypothetical protein